jgi:cytochrome c
MCHERLGTWAAWGVVAALAVVGCAALPLARTQKISRGDPEFGKQALVDYGCVSCHSIPGVPGAHAYVGPPLDHYGLRSFVAGALTNNQDNLVRWVMNPQAVKPGTAMPNLHVSENDAINISAYLLSLD